MLRRDLPNGSVFRYAKVVFHGKTYRNNSPVGIYRTAIVRDPGHAAEGCTVDVPWATNPWASKEVPPKHRPCMPKLDEEVEIVETDR